MQLLSRRSQPATERALVVADRNDPVMPAVLEFQLPSTAIVNAPIPRAARHTAWIVTSLMLACIAALALIKVDRVVAAQGQVVSQTPTMVVQPMQAAIVSAIDVHPGEVVKAGQVLAKLNPTFANADLQAISERVSSLQAELDRYRAEHGGKDFSYSGTDPDRRLQAAIYSQREAEYKYQLQTYAQKAASLAAQIAAANADAAGYKQRLAVAQDVETMRNSLEKMQVGSRLKTLAAIDDRAEMSRELATSKQKALSAQRDLAALVATRDAYVQQWHANLADKIAETTSKLSSARADMNKAKLLQQLVVMRAGRKAIVQSIAQVSPGSVLHPGEQLMTLVPTDAPLEVTANVPGSEDGFIGVGDPVAIKFATLPFTRYGMAHGTVRVVSPDSFTAQDLERHPTSGPQVPATTTEPFYRARITIDKVALHNVPAGFHLMPGMPVTADVKVGKHSILQYLLGQVLPTFRDGMREP